MKFLLFLMILIGSMPCIVMEDPDNSVNSYDFPFKLDKPDKLSKLNDELNEISGLAYYEKDDHLLTIADNSSFVYLLDRKGDIIKKTDLGVKRDYEGIAFAKDVTYIITSDGRLRTYHVDWAEEEILSSNTYKTGLSSLQEPEGICYGGGNTMYLALKGMPGTSITSIIGKAIYSLNINSLDKPAKKEFVFTMDDFLAFDPDLNEKTSDHAYSGCAIDPMTGDLYVLSAVNEWLFVFDKKKGRLRHAERFKLEDFSQPEGICFDPEGNMYVASEGKSKKALLAYYNRK